MVIHTVNSADTPSGQSFIAEVNQILTLPADGAGKRVAFDCEGVNLSRLGTDKSCPSVFPHLMSIS
jgi:hypothetical protein